MNKNRMLVDMHLHTTASDGSFSPSEVVQRVKSSGVKVFSLTDHDTTAACTKSKMIYRREWNFSRALNSPAKPETSSAISSDTRMTIITLIYKALAAAEAKREDKLAIRIEHLREVDGIELTADEIAELEEIPSAGKPHIANILMRRGSRYQNRGYKQIS